SVVTDLPVPKELCMREDVTTIFSSWWLSSQNAVPEDKANIMTANVAIRGIKILYRVISYCQPNVVNIVYNSYSI
ncbi:MAG: hypothetical protein WC482_05410, partial [Candidatus Omnitrophota bacterium]